ncbi:MAG: NAD(P)-dependent oxidoreductase [Candidatus Omnitrophota bacterium]|jgi:nucleoside-diphosphate-sugar epimerase
MKFLITGATGYIGKFITVHLSNKYGKENIDVCIRSQKKAKAIKDHVNHIHFVDLVDSNLSFLKLEHYNYVILAHGKILGHTYKSIYINNRKAVRNIIKNLNKAKLKQIIYLSSVAAGGFKDDSNNSQMRMLEPDNAYGKAKLKTEELLIRYSIDNLIKVAILRPPIVYGSVSGIDFDQFIKGCKIGYLQYFAGNPNISLCSIENLTQAVICAIENKAAGVYQIADEKKYTIQEVYNVIRKAYGLKEVHLSGTFFKPIVDILVKTALRFKNFSFPYLFLLQTMHNPYYCNIDKAKKELGFKPNDTFDKYFTKVMAKNYFVKSYLN